MRLNISCPTEFLSKRGFEELMNSMTFICPPIIFNFARVVQKIFHLLACPQALYKDMERLHSKVHYKRELGE